MKTIHLCDVPDTVTDSPRTHHCCFVCFFVCCLFCFVFYQHQFCNTLCLNLCVCWMRLVRWDPADTSACFSPAGAIPLPKLTPLSVRDGCLCCPAANTLKSAASVSTIICFCSKVPQRQVDHRPPTEYKSEGPPPPTPLPARVHECGLCTWYNYFSVTLGCCVRHALFCVCVCVHMFIR